MTTKPKKPLKSNAASQKSKPASKPVPKKKAPKVKAKAARAAVKPTKVEAKITKSSSKPAAKAKPAAKLSEKSIKKAAAPAPKATQAKVAPKAAAAAAPAKKPEAPKPHKADPVPAKPAAKIEAKVETKAEAKVEHKVEARPETRKEEKKPSARSLFKTKEYVVYPSHGVGQILTVEEQEVAGHKLELFVINFDKEKMTLRVPTHKAQAVGMRKLSDNTVVENAIETLRGRARIKRTMWSRRAQEYEAKINSGDLISIAEVVRDLYRSERQPEQSYSERQLYEAALDRMAREVAVVERIGEDAAILRVEAALQGGSGRGEKIAPKTEAEAPEAA